MLLRTNCISLPEVHFIPYEVFHISYFYRTELTCMNEEDLVDMVCMDNNGCYEMVNFRLSSWDDRFMPSI